MNQKKSKLKPKQHKEGIIKITKEINVIEIRKQREMTKPKLGSFKL